MAKAQGFWSYVHKDDKTESGRISQLARDVVAQYEMITGEAIELFLDRDSLEWGDEWQAKVDASLASVAFFIRNYSAPGPRAAVNELTVWGLVG